jgi:hypothetical protein
LLAKVLHGGDQLPFGPHSDAVGWEERVEDLESQRGGKIKVLHCEADGGGALADHANVCRCGEELEKARARVLIFAEAQRRRIVVQLRNTSETGAHEVETTSLKRVSLPASGRARWGASGADSNGAAIGVRMSREEQIGDGRT